MIIGHGLIAHVGGVDLRYEDTILVQVTFGKTTVTASASADDSAAKPDSFHHADVEHLSNGDIVLHFSDLVLHCHAKVRYWELSWKWLNNREPAGCVGSGLGEYPRTTVFGARGLVRGGSCKVARERLDGGT